MTDTVFSQPNQPSTGWSKTLTGTQQSKFLDGTTYGIYTAFQRHRQPHTQYRTRLLHQHLCHGLLESNIYDHLPGRQ